MTKHIGVVGVSPEGASLCLRQLSRQAAHSLPPREHPRISLHNEPLAEYIEAIEADDWHRVGDLLRRSAEVLAGCGAEFCITPDNAVQYAIHLAEHGSPIPWLALPDLVADAVLADHRTRVGIIGTRVVTMGSTYQSLLGIRGVQVLAPAGEEISSLDRIIFQELIYGDTRTESQREILRIVANLASSGCEGVILGSSETPLLINSENSPLPVYDAGAILAERALGFAMASR
ncbi:MAG: amino acid racemase [Phycisphaeraceae bacterium]|nr:amino acid racemase [Phycisphaeraceae bacterium]